MFRWLIRFTGAALIGALLVWLWNRYNQDLLEEELEDEIPLEFDVPAQAEPSSSTASASSTNAATGAGSAGTPAASISLDGDNATAAADTPPPATSPSASASTSGGTTAAAKSDESAATDDVSASQAAGDASADEAGAENPAPVLDSPAPTPAGAGDNVIIIKGIGPKYGAKLAEMGITTFGALLATPLDTLALAFPRVPDGELQNWLEQARELAGQSDETA